MTIRKERLTVTVNPDLVLAGNQAVAAGAAESLSAWVNEALSERVTRDRRLAALSEAIAGHEADHGEITLGEMSALARSDREAAVVVRGRTPPSSVAS